VTAERVADLAIRDLGEGTILLLHDSPRYAPRPTAEPTVAALDGIVAEVRERGLQATGL
jgi:hypothetical protein